MTSNRIRRIRERNAKAFDFAETNRQFEIELYWKRSAYFWTFTALAFAGYGALQTHCCDLDDRETLSFLLANIGFVASFAWFLANKGSKFWQEQWETHVDVLEDRMIGTVYKKRFVRKPISKSCKVTQFITGCDPRNKYSYSVTKINHIGSFYVVFIWIILIVRSSEFSFPEFSFLDRVDPVKLAATIGSAVAVLLLWKCGRSGMCGYEYDEKIRAVKRSPKSS